MPDPTVITLDLKFLGEDAAIAVFVVPDAAGDGLTLVECGPFATHDNLLAALAQYGLEPDQVHTVLLTHIHFDHAGAAWWWARRGARVYVHPRGHRHLLDPARLYASAARIYGAETMESLWGRMEEIEAEQLVVTADRDSFSIGGRQWTAHHTPGHANHHIAWATGEVVFTGDVGGVTIQGGPVVPPLPPPDVDVAAWQDSLERLASLKATTFYLTHFGRVAANGDHLSELERRLLEYVAWIEKRAASGQEPEQITEGFTRYYVDELREAGVADDVIPAYLAANPPGMSVTGVLRWLRVRDSA